MSNGCAPKIHLRGVKPYTTTWCLGHRPLLCKELVFIWILLPILLIPWKTHSIFRNSLWHPGAYAPVIVFKINFFLKTLRKNLKFFGHKHMQVFNNLAKFRKEITLYLVREKMTKSVAEIRFKNTFFKARILSFLHRPRKMLFPAKFCTNVEHLYIFVPNCFQIFLRCFHIFLF